MAVTAASGYGGYGGRGYGGYGQGSSSASQDDDPHLRSAEAYINNRNYSEALNVLNSISDRTARWYYLSARANYGSGNNVLAREHAEKAVQMDPNNMEYQQFLQQMEGGGQWYQNMGQNYGNPMQNAGNYCTTCCLAWLFCSCCCGGGGMYAYPMCCC